jgi:hypothetical protein
MAKSILLNPTLFIKLARGKTSFYDPFTHTLLCEGEIVQIEAGSRVASALKNGWVVECSEQQYNEYQNQTLK